MQTTRRHLEKQQRGAAVLMALFVATLATVIVSGLFWTQFVLLRTIENQQLVSQSRLLLRGALDWARAILRTDTNQYDANDEPWSQELKDTRLDQLGETSALAAQAVLSGRISDAQGRYNLRNLLNAEGQPDEREVDALGRLLQAVELPEQGKLLIAQRMMEAAAPTPSTDANQSFSREEKPRPLPPVFPEDVLAIAGLDPAKAVELSKHIIVLDERTPLNVNTADAKTIAARLDIPASQANALVNERTRLGHFKSLGEVQNRLPGVTIQQSDLSVASRYFFVEGNVRLDRSNITMQALVKRNRQGNSVANQPVTVVWQREL